MGTVSLTESGVATAFDCWQGGAAVIMLRRTIITALVQLSLVTAIGSVNHDEVVAEVKTALTNLTQTNSTDHLHEMSPEAQKSVKSIANVNLFSQRRLEKPAPDSAWSLDCAACEAGATLLIELFQTGVPLWEVEVAVTSLCILLQIEAAEVCEGMVHNYGYQVEYIVNQLGKNVSADLFCGVFVGGDCGDTGTINDWTVEVPGNKPMPSSPEPPSNSSDRLRVLQVTDVHLDLSYLVGSPTRCGLPCCCMESTGLAGPDQAGAGFWGDYNCDLPSRTFTAMVEQIANTEQGNLDYIIYTGDAPAHDVWLQTKEKNLEHQLFVLDTFAALLPEVPLYLTLGNHEGFPVNAFPTDDQEDSIVSGAWLYEGLASHHWADNLEPEERERFRRNGFYSALVRPKLRIISVNNNFCVGMNFFMMLDFSDPADQLDWLARQLELSEAAGEAVHILAHHPPSSCLPGWAREYTRIVNRFESTVVAQFHGHTHDDWFLVFHNESGAPSTTAFVATSVTTYTDNSPEYRIYEVNGNENQPSFGFVVDHHTWNFDLSKVSNDEGASTVWRHLYSASTNLGLKGVGPQHWMEVLDRAANDDVLFEEMVTFYHQNRTSGSLPDRSSFLCRMMWNKKCPF